MTATPGSLCTSICPLSPVHDLVIKDNDLVVATHGRAFWILDDISPLRQLDAEVEVAPVISFCLQPPCASAPALTATRLCRRKSLRERIRRPEQSSTIT